MYNFSEIIDRKGSGSIKIEALNQFFGRKDLIPLWVADMDFRTPDFITDALKDRVGHPIFGYSAIPDDYFTTIAAWVHELHDWDVDPQWIRYIPGIVKGIAMVLECFFDKDAKVIIQSPVYHPFRNVPTGLGHTVVTNPLRPVYGSKGELLTYHMDLEDLDAKLSEDSSIKVLILSNPHNPCGIAWDRSELEGLAVVAQKHNLLVISDEIHSEMVLGGRKHIPFASVSDEAARHSITFQAPSKTFNIAGIVSSYTIIPDDGLRGRFFQWLDAGEFDAPCLFSTIATMAAYKHGRQWRSEMLDYLQGNVDFVESFISQHIPGIHCVRPQASFLVWLDCRALGLDHDALVDLFVNKAHLALNDGAMFGTEGSGFMRLNVGCPRSILEKAMQQLDKAINN